MRRLAAIACWVLAMSGCSSSADGEAPAVEPTPTVAQEPTSSVTVSDAVPSLEELREMGLTDAQAECFVTTIDPQGSGKVSSVELFVEAFGNCL